MRCTIYAFVVLSTICCAGIASADVTNGVSFTHLGFYDGTSTFSQAAGVSSNGSVVVGWRNTATSTQGFFWTPSGGMTLLPGFPSASSPTQAFGVSADGSIIAGNALNQGIIWTGPSYTPQSINTPSAVSEPNASAISLDGSVIVGSSSTANHIYRWTAATKAVDIISNSSRTSALGVSQDGSVVAGSYAGGDLEQAFRWTSGTGLVTLDDLAGGLNDTWANGISANGSVIVGYSSSDRARNGEAVYWDASGIHTLSNSPGPNTSQAYATSSDGSVIVGQESFSSALDEAFIWDASHGLQNLHTLLANDGIDLTGWNLDAATAISPDGWTVAGYGTNPSGQHEAWVATLPEPMAAGVIAFSLIVLRAGRGSQRRNIK